MKEKKEITLVETIQAVNGKFDHLRKALREIVPLCRLEKGCLQYDLLEPTTGQEEFLVLMRWEDPEDLKRHESSKIIQDFVKKHDGVLYCGFTMSEWKLVR